MRHPLCGNIAVPGVSLAFDSVFGSAGRSVHLSLVGAALAMICPTADAQSVAVWGSRGLSNIDDVSAMQRVVPGRFHSVGVRADGKVACWGRSTEGQCIVPTDLGPCVAVEPGQLHTIALLAGGGVRCWGSNQFGQCNFPTSFGNVVRISTISNHSAAMSADGAVVCWGYNASGQCNVPTGLGLVQWVEAADTFTYAIRTDGSLVGWGQLGTYAVPAGLPPLKQVEVGPSAIALQSDGGVVCWGGSNTYGERNVPAGLSGVVQVAAGSSITNGFTSGAFCVARRKDGTLVKWGTGPSVPASIGAVADVSAMNGIAVVKPDGSPLLLVSGSDASNDYGQSQLPGGFRRVVELCVGSTFVAARSVDGSVATWGTAAPLPGGLAEVIDIDASYQHIAALRVDGGVACWGGTNTYGELNVPADLGVATAVDVGLYHTLALRADGTARGWGQNTYGQASPPLNATGLTRISAGAFHSAALKSDGTVLCWGGTGDERIVPPALGLARAVAAGSAFTVGVRVNGTVLSWGVGPTPQPAMSGVLDVKAAASHAICLLADGSVVAWGNNTFRQSDEPPGLMPAVQVGAGEQLAAARVCNAPFAIRSSPNLGSLGFGTPRQYVFTGLRPAASEVRIQIDVRGDLGASDEFLTVNLDGQPVGQVFGAEGSDCPATPDRAFVTLGAQQFNALVPDGRIVVRLEASSPVSATQCIGPIAKVQIEYTMVPVDCNRNGRDDACDIELGIAEDLDANGIVDSCDLDCDGNGLVDPYEIAADPLLDCDGDFVLDSCEILAGAADADGDGVLDSCERQQGDLNLDGTVGAQDLAMLLGVWGQANPPYGDLSGDGVVGPQDLAAILASWGPV
jgi:alpha-tubulin suppressor-like RCC1 family protein